MQYENIDNEFSDTEVLPDGSEQNVRSIERPDRLIFGKFRTEEEAEKDYRLACEARKKLDECQKELESCRSELADLENDKTAQRNGFSNRYEIILNDEVKQKELDNYTIAATHLFHPQKSLEICRMIESCRRAPTNEDLARIRQFFPSEVIALASADVTLFRHLRQEEYQKMLEGEKNARYQRQIDSFRRQNPNWNDTAFYNKLLRQALELSDGCVDLCVLKSVVETIGHEAVEKYKQDQEARLELEDLQDGLAVVDHTDNGVRSKKWLTREAYYALSPEEEAEKYDLIVEQVKLENQGRLPRLLTLK